MKRMLILVLALAASPVAAQSFQPAGTLTPGSGRGRNDGRVWAPGMRFPIRDLPAYANSQVYGVGGYSGPRGGQCDSRNYSFPWWDNYCESRSWKMPLCPSGRGHQGQDIRPSSCRAGVHPAVAAAAGTITNVGRFSVYLTGADGTRYDYLHMSNVRVRVGQRVSCGDVLGMVSNTFNGTPTTIHLHFNIRQAVRGLGSVYVPPYTSLVDSYGRVQGGSACTPSMTMDGGVQDAGRVDGGRVDSGSGTGGQNGCYSSTLRRPVEHGECVQVTAAGCGSGSCAWYTCQDGYWQCTQASACDVRHPNAACGTDAGPPRDGGTSVRRSCRSTLLGRNVNDGTCVQVTGRARPGEPESCADGCGWYECNDGTWTCTESAACRGDQFPFAACAPAGDDCRSATLGSTVGHGDCVQVHKAGCGLDRCGWYTCADGRWACADPTNCRGVTYEHMACGDFDLCEMNQDCDSCNRATGCGWCADTGECMSDRKRVDCGSSWRDEPNSCPDCSGYSDCGSCVRDGFCGWCPGVGCLNDSTEQAQMCSGYMPGSCG